MTQDLLEMIYCYNFHKAGVRVMDLGEILIYVCSITYGILTFNSVQLTTRYIGTAIVEHP